MSVNLEDTFSWSNLVKIISRNATPTPWSKHYAMLPVRDMHGKWHWCETVFARRNWRSKVSTNKNNGIVTTKWEQIMEYGTLFDVLKDNNEPK